MTDTFLEKVLKSKKQTGLVAFFLANPERAFYLGELQKRLGSRTLAPHLNFLVKENFVDPFSKKKLKYYRINQKNISLPVFRQTVLKHSRRYEDELLKELNRLKGLKQAVLSGLFVGNINAECDLLLVGDIKERSLRKFINGVENIMGQEINYALLSPGEFEFRKNIFDRFTKDIFENEHLVIKKSR